MSFSKCIVIFVVLFAVLSGCSNSEQNTDESMLGKNDEPTIQGYVIDISDKSLLVVWDVKYDDLEAKTKNEILQLAKPNAMHVTYENATDFAIGDHVDIWTTGYHNSSYPEQGTAIKIVKLELE